MTVVRFIEAKKAAPEKEAAFLFLRTTPAGRKPKHKTV
jgi:hypothetical protein